MMSFRHDTIKMSGTIQGVGFRPALYRLATQLNLTGTITNFADSVVFEAYGSSENLNEFKLQIESFLPKKAIIRELSVISEKTNSRPNILKIISDKSNITTPKVTITPDLAICDVCKKELLNKNNTRHFNYAFNSCGDCGPRYSIMNTLPYDREHGSMKLFPMCDECQKEYTDITNRRFNIENISCNKCGPKFNYNLEDVVEHLNNGKIIAIKSIGGYQIIADAKNFETVKRLRILKERPDKPFAIMVKNIETIKKYCMLNAKSQQLLESEKAPIVLLPKTNNLLNYLAPDSLTLGIMLPYSPMHCLLFEYGAPEVLIATSANNSGLPTIIDEDNLDSLKDIVDYIITNNRIITNRNDDSIITSDGQVTRRARGYAPSSFIYKETQKKILATGADLKNTITMTNGKEVVLNSHLGDINHYESYLELKNSYNRFSNFFNFIPDAVVVDLHPDYFTTKFGEELAHKYSIPIIRVQHHHAHAVSVMAEHKLENALALVFDGTGYGVDGNIWGAELLAATKNNFKRIASFAPSPLLGGDIATIDIERQFIARSLDAGIDLNIIRKFTTYDENSLEIIVKQYNKSINSPLSHSAGRLFDAFSWLLNIHRKKISYEGQAAIKLESRAGKLEFNGNYSILPKKSFELLKKDAIFLVDWNALFADPMRYNTCDLTLASVEFHAVLAEAATAMVKVAPQDTTDIVLTGGVFQNQRLAFEVESALTKIGYNVLQAHRIPPNDGGISFGQSIIGIEEIL